MARTVDQTPSVARLFGRAALGAVVPSLGRVGELLPVDAPRGDGLPAESLVQTGVVVEEEQAAAYAQVVGARHGGPVPTFLPHVLGFGLSLELLTSSEMPFPLLGMVHVAQHATVHAPVHVGDRLDLEVGVADLRPHRAGRQFDVLLTARRDDDVVWRGVSTYLSRGPGAEPDAPSPGPSRAPEPSDAALRIDVPGDVGRRYAGVAGDANPIHLHALTAKAFGFPRAIAHGMWTLARVVATLEGRVPAEVEVGCRFEKPVLLPASTLLTAVDDGGTWRMALHDRRKPDVRHCTVAVTPR